jgi:aspartate ammonia-lyase
LKQYGKACIQSRVFYIVQGFSICYGKIKLLNTPQGICMSTMSGSNIRREKDSLGERTLPSEVYYGIQTLRAVENFPISGIKPLPVFIDACVLIKKAAARINTGLGHINGAIGSAVIAAADEIVQGRLRDQFVVDMYQAGAGTSMHMNVNEVLANRALEILGDTKGNYERLSPNDHVNFGQSTNDVIPTAVRIAAVLALDRFFYPALSAARAALQEKAAAFRDIVKAGRTHLRDAVPVRLGDEFSAWAHILSDHRLRIENAGQDLHLLGIGGSAVGTGLNTYPGYRSGMIEALSELLQKPFAPAPHMMAAMQSMAVFVHLSGTLRNLSQDLVKLSHDLRLLSSGPGCGINEITLPAVQPGSSIMPGKYNPVIPEMLSMVCFQIMGYDSAISLAGQAGQLELNVMMPLIAYDLLHGIEILGNALKVLAERCLAGITANTDRCRRYAEASIETITVLSPHIGYLHAAALADEALTTGKTLREIVLEKGLMQEEELMRILDLDSISRMRD